MPDEVERLAGELSERIGRQVVERRTRELLEGLGPSARYDAATKEALVAKMLADPDLMAAADALAPGEIALVEAAIEDARQWYVGTNGKRHRIVEMPNGHLHNACARLKQVRLGGVWAFTILAMDAEIARREAEKENRDGG